jgi:8-oxo-dGTP pyrophosphatase MutT (NUDIX family)
MGAPVIDLLYRTAYRSAYRAMRVYWAAVHPKTHGALVAIWHGGEVLLVKNSYVPYYSLPGGYVRPSETGVEAALRELHEETGMRLGPADLKLVLDEKHDWEGKREHIEIFEVDAAQRPTITVDGREVVSAQFYPPRAALELHLFPPLRKVIERRMHLQSGT